MLHLGFAVAIVSFLPPLTSPQFTFLRKRAYLRKRAPRHPFQPQALVPEPHRSPLPTCPAPAKTTRSSQMGRGQHRAGLRPGHAVRRGTGAAVTGRAAEAPRPLGSGRGGRRGRGGGQGSIHAESDGVGRGC